MEQFVHALSKQWIRSEIDECNLQVALVKGYIENVFRDPELKSQHLIANFVHYYWINDFNSCSLYLQPPIVPEVSHDGDTRNFDDYPNDDWQKATAVSEEQLKHFKDFWSYKMYIVTYFVDEPHEK